MAAAADNEILVSDLTRQLAGGSGHGFADRGGTTLRGITEPVHLFALEPHAG